VLDRPADRSLAAVCDELAEAARELAAASALRSATPSGDGEARPGDGVRALLDAAADAVADRRDPGHRAAARLNEALELLGPRTTPDRTAIR
jgi:hypothetical protein